MALAAGCAAAAVALVWRGSPVPVAAPAPDPVAAAACERILARLPRTLAGAGTWPTTPASPYTRAWRRPTVTLSCGEPVPVGTLSAADLCISSSSDDCGGGVHWFQDAGRQQLWQTRVPPVLVVTVPPSLGAVDVLGPITDALLAEPGAGK